MYILNRPWRSSVEVFPSTPVRRKKSSRVWKAVAPSPCVQERRQQALGKREAGYAHPPPASASVYVCL